MTTEINSQETYAEKTVLDDINGQGKDYLTTKGYGSNPTRTRFKDMHVIQDGVNNSHLGADTMIEELAAYRGQSESSRKYDYDVDKLYRGIGSEINGNDSIDTQLQKANLNFKICSSPIRFGDNYKFRSSVKNAIYKEDGTLIDVVSGDWAANMLQTRDVLEVFNQFANESGLNIEHIGAIERYKKQETAMGQETCLNLSMFAVCDLNEDFDVNNSDQITGKLVLTSPYSYGSGYKISVMAIRKVCTNGQHLPVTLKRKVLSHVMQFPKEAIAEALQGAKTLWSTYTEEADLMSKVGVSQVEALLILLSEFAKIKSNQQFAKNLLAQLQAQAITEKTAETLLWDKLILDDESKIVNSCYQMFRNSSFIGGDNQAAYQTAWGLLNCVTEYYNHHQVSKDANVQLNSLWNGNKASQTQAFLNSISAFANVKHYGKQTETVGQSVRAW